MKIKNINFKIPKLVTVIPVILSATISAHSNAEEALGSIKKESGKLENVIVIVTKRPENIQDVPVAVTAFSEQAIEDAGISTIQHIDGFIPNVRIGSGGGVRNTPITIRGIVSDANNPGIEQAAGVYIDGVYMGRPTTINSPLYDLQRIEVLRGPQGTLFGKNTVAGAVNIISRLPTEENELELILDYGNFNAINLFATASGAVSENVNMRFSASSINRDGFITNSLGPDNQDTDSTNFRFTAVYEPSESAKYIFRADGAKDRTHAGQDSIFVNGLVEQVFGYTPAEDPFDRQVDDDLPAFQNRDVWGASLEAIWGAENTEITSITAYRGFKFNNAASFDGAPLDFGSSGIKEKQSQFSQELRLSGEFGEGSNYVAGVYYFKQELNTDPIITPGPGLDNLFTLFAQLGVFDADFGGLQVLAASAGAGNAIEADLKNESYALFTQVDFGLTDNLSFTAGVRYTHEKKEIIYSQTDHLIGEFIVDFTPIGGGIAPFPIFPSTVSAENDFTDSEISGSLSLNYDLNEDVMVYGSYGRGFKAGGYNAFNLVQPDGSIAVFEPETVDSFEIGLKSMLLDDTFRVNAALFYLDYQNLQVTQRVTPTGGGLPVFVVSNAATAKSKGAEVELQALLTSRLQLQIALGYNDAGYKDFSNATPAGDDFSGNRFASSPKSSASIALQHTLQINSNWDLQSRFETKYRGAYFNDANNSSELEQEGYSLTNIRISFINESSGLNVALWGRNIFDQDYATVIQYADREFFPGHIIGNLGHPRTYGIELRLKF